MEDVAEKDNEEILATEFRSTAEDENVVVFETNDPANPLNWPIWYKWVLVALISTTNMIKYVHRTLLLNLIKTFLIFSSSSRMTL